MKKMKVVAIDNDRIIHQVMKHWISSTDDFEIVGSAYTGEDGIKMCAKFYPKIAIVDIHMPDINGFDICRELKTISPRTKIVIFSALCDPYCIYRVAELGVPGYIEKGRCLSEEIIYALRQVASGRTYYAPIFDKVMESHLSKAEAFNRILTPKELSILCLTVMTIDDSTICKKLGISANTLATHRRTLHRKLGTKNDRSLFAYAMKWGLMPPKADWIVKDL